MEAVVTPWRDMLPISWVGDCRSGEAGSEELPSWPPGGAEEGRGGKFGTSRVEDVEWRDMLSSVAGCVDSVPETEEWEAGRCGLESSLEAIFEEFKVHEGKS